MKITQRQKIINKNGHEYIFVKKYPNFILYQNRYTKVKECFSMYDLGLINKQEKVYNLSPNKIKR